MSKPQYQLLIIDATPRNKALRYCFGCHETTVFHWDMRQAMSCFDLPAFAFVASVVV